MATPINPDAQWPGDNMRPDQIEQAAGQIRTVGSNVSATGGDVAKAWSGLKKGYHAPEQDTLFGAMQPATQAATDFGTDMGKVATALTTFAGEVRTIKANVAKIRAEARAFVGTIHNGKVTITEHVVQNRAQLEMGESTTTHKDVDWNSDQATVEQNNALIRRVNDQQEQLWAAERKCANAIRDVYGAAHIFAASESNPHGYGVNQIPDNASNLPWGNTVDVKESCGDKVADGVFIDGIMNGLGGFIGFHYTQPSAMGPEQAGFSWSTLGQHWEGLGQLATGVAVPVSPALAYLPGPVGKWFNSSTEAEIGFVPGFFGIDAFNHNPNQHWITDWNHDPLANWKNNPARTAGSVGFNVVTLAIPGPKGLGALTKAGEVARTADEAGDVANASRAADGLGDVAKVSGDGLDLSKIGGDATKADLGNLGKVTDNLGDGLNGIDKTDINIPDAPNVPHDSINIDHPNTGDHVPTDPPPARNPSPLDQNPVDQHPGDQQPVGHQSGPADGSPPDGTRPSGAHPGKLYDPHAPVAETEPAKDAPVHYTPHDVQQALDHAPVNEHGEPVDPRTGEPLLLHRSDGARGWEMRWDPENHEWVAQNLGSGYAEGLPVHGDPGSFGYDEHGNRMPYANHRPAYAPGQVVDVWRAADTDHDGVVTVLNKDDVPVEIHWDETSSRDGVWDMGHVPGAEYAKLRHLYLNHEISYKEFIDRYQDPSNYEVQDVDRNRSHLDEVP